MASKYEQQVTMTLTLAQACSLRVQLAEYLRNINTSDAHPNSCVGNAVTMLEELTQVMLGNKNTKFITYKMIEVK